MLVGRGSCELSGRKLHRKIKKSQPLSEAPHNDDFVGGFDEKHPPQVSAYGTASGNQI
jgi:hypothetical protein